MRTKMKPKKLFFLVMTAVFTFAPAAPAADEEAGGPKASGYNVQRIEQEDRYAVPEEKTAEVWAFLEETFVKNIDQLKEIDPGLTSYSNAEEFTDVYFDTPDWKVLGMTSGIRHRKRLNLTNPEDRKSGRELLQIKLSPDSVNLLERKEMKFEIKPAEKPKSPEDMHPMLGLVKESQREELKAALKPLGLDALEMRPVLTIKDLRTRIYLLRDGKPFISISHDVASSEVNGKKAKIVEIEYELNEIAFTEADDETRKYMEAVNARLIEMVLRRFPDLKRDLTPKYNRAYEQLKKQGAF